MINMTAFNDNGNVKQFQLIKLINENSDDEHIITKATVVLRRDKIEAPYYMVTKIKISSCVDNADGGLIHAMDMISHNRMHNLTEEKYGEIESLIEEASASDGIEVTSSEKGVKLALLSRSNEESINLLEKHHELFEKIDGLVD